MAFSIAPFYAIHGSVGKGGANHTGDVMLVQFFLFKLLVDPGWPTPWGKDTCMGLGPAAIFPADGVYKPELADWIKCFQEFANRNDGGPLIVDGLVSERVWGWGERAPKAHRWNTIHAMNRMLFLTNKERFCDLANDWTVPAGLKGQLSLVTCI